MRRGSAATAATFLGIHVATLLAIFLSEGSQRFRLVSTASNLGFSAIAIVMIVDVGLLAIGKTNWRVLAWATFGLAAYEFFLLECAFLTDLLGFRYVWQYSAVDMEPWFKAVAPWAGQAGSLMLWMVLSTLVGASYRRGLDLEPSQASLFAAAAVQVVNAVVFVVVAYLAPFEVWLAPIFEDGLGLNPLLKTQYMIWHPLFVFASYAALTVPFVLCVAFLLRPSWRDQTNERALAAHLRWGWLVLSLGIGLGTYWAKQSFAWERWWGWDPVETATLAPWFLATAYFHQRGIRQRNPRLEAGTVVAAFGSVVFASLLTRGGGLNSLHSFAGNAQLVTWLVVEGGALLALLLAMAYAAIGSVVDDWGDARKVLDQLGYLVLLLFAVAFTLGLYLPSLTWELSRVLPLDTFYVGEEFFSNVGLALAIALSVVTYSCTLARVSRSGFKHQVLGLLVPIAVDAGALAGGLASSEEPGLFAVPFYLVAAAACLVSLASDLRKRGLRTMAGPSVKTLVHLGTCLVLVGTATTRFAAYEYFYVVGFLVMVGGFLPGLLANRGAKVEGERVA
ncbi:MAG: hypothetical protein Kow0069_35660 [Promethearchaeota archaeon]